MRLYFNFSSSIQFWDHILVGFWIVCFVHDCKCNIKSLTFFFSFVFLSLQILNVKIRRLEHLLHLKDLRIEDLTKRLQQVTQPPPRQLPPQANPPHPPTVDPQIPSMHMHHQNPLPPLHHTNSYGYNSQQLQEQ